ncbi:MAG: ribose 5-phosphate isomerase B [Bacteroidales bacterium]|jgi:ribose 5-phosphate isomerase B|nr:ribose 5-phosphate isomerase B [Bacteroidales bacterium]
MQNIPIASDHAGFEMKQKLIKSLNQEFAFDDLGTYSEEPVDYPDFAHKEAKLIQDKVYEKGILLCGSGNGVAMAANKHVGIRAALCWNAKIAELARCHNNANILVLPGRFIDLEEAKNCVKIFFSTNFEGGRHEKRVQKIDI